MENHNSSKKRLKTENPNSKIKEAKLNLMEVKYHESKEGFPL